MNKDCVVLNTSNQPHQSNITQYDNNHLRIAVHRYRTQNGKVAHNTPQ